MQEQNCPKCDGEMDTGKLGIENVMYFSNWQKNFFKAGTLIDKARACTNCGFVELYLDPEVLKQKIQANQ
ncbi:hypothetical protein H6G89_00815 [Oscillatoria sp. FACHB-1407]|uniref:PF20097 family protein n=1 Tax=Oscillatoria sp. FACHB-1407 TaxID=2692847 RepID=UPI001686F18B|nr:PF20097 family protein [Oscillatoria sp. FACHB-1407]MBD2459571.1 hypothetical protein [Oscillatoria sp. FACHB-1407]